MNYADGIKAKPGDLVMGLVRDGFGGRIGRIKTIKNGRVTLELPDGTPWKTLDEDSSECIDLMLASYCGWNN